MFSSKLKRLSVLQGALLSVALLSGCGSDEVSNTNIQQTFLPVDEAFVFSAKTEGGGLVTASWKIADGYRLYKDQFKFSVSPEEYQITKVSYPPATMFDDKNLGKKESYKGSVDVTIEVSGKSVSGEFHLTSKYQGCADVGLCYPPETRKNTFSLLMQ